MEEKNVSYIAFESVCCRFERMNKRLWILCIVLVILLISSNLAWLNFVQQFEKVTTTIEATQDVDSEGTGDAIINDEVHINGEDKTDGEGNEN